ncbi:hypothetical protein BC830DRAFT_1122786 [Chytriomyces sp. MP71]|nr:hypothetical protein BC830DRAFT_1122786 [Chytriomyces sp. MP71]
MLGREAKMAPSPTSSPTSRAGTPKATVVVDLRGSASRRPMRAAAVKAKASQRAVRASSSGDDDDDEEEDDDDHDDEESTPKPVNKTRQRPTPKSRYQNTQSDDASLFSLVASSNANNASLNTAVAEWIDEWANTQSRNQAIQDIILFVVKCTGNSGTVPMDSILNEDLITETLEELQKKIESTDNYPLIAKRAGSSATASATRKPASASKFRSNLTHFWSRWFTQLAHLPENSPMYANPSDDDDDDDTPSTVFDTVKAWLMSMSSSSYRSFRHTATTVSLLLMSSLCDTCATLVHDRAALLRQLETAKGTRASQLDRDIAVLTARTETLERHMGDFFDSVFIHRYRDTDPVIRAECIAALGGWIATHPDVYLDASYLRYVGWMLSNDAHGVRLAAVDALRVLYETPERVGALRAFTERFKARLVEMAVREVHPATRVAALKVVMACVESGLVGDEERLALLALLFCEDAGVQGLVGGFVAKAIVEEVIPAALEDAAAAVGEEGESAEEVRREWVRWKAVAAFLVEIAGKVEENVALSGAPNSSTPANSSSTSSFALKDSQSQNQSQSQQEDTNTDLDEEVNEDDLEDEERDFMIGRLRFLSEVRDWCFASQPVEASASKITVLGSANMKSAVTSLYDDLEILKEWESGLEYLSTDLSVTSEADNASQIVMRIQTLSPDEELCLALMLNAVLGQASDSSTGESKRPREGDEEGSTKVSRALVKFLPRLLKKYGNEYEGVGHRILIEVVKMVRQLNVVVYLELRLLKAYESLLDDLITIFLRQSDATILREFERTFAGLTGGNNIAPSSRPTTPAKNKRALAMETTNTEASSAGLYQSAKQKLEDTVEEHVTTQLASCVRKLQTAPAFGVDAVAEVEAVLKRVKALGFVIDLSKISFKVGKGGRDGGIWTSIAEILEDAENMLVKSYAASATRMELLDADDEIGVPEEVKLAQNVAKTICVLLETLSLDAVYALHNFMDGQPHEDVELSDELSGKLRHISKLSELLLSDDLEASFAVGAKLTASQTLVELNTALYIMSARVPALLSCGILQETQEMLVSHCMEVFECVGIVDPHLKGRLARQLCLRDPVLRRLKPLALDSPSCIDAFSCSLLRLASGLCILICGGVLKAPYSAQIAQFVGISERDAGTSFLDLPVPDVPIDLPAAFVKARLFGPHFDQVAEHVLQRLGIDKIKRYFARFEVKNEDNEPSVSVDVVGGVIEETVGIFENSLMQSFELYLTRKVDSLKPMEALARLLIAKIKTWPTILVGDGDDHLYLQATATRALLLLLRSAINKMADVSQAHVVSGNRSLAEVTEAWAVWGAVGGCISAVVSAFGVKYEAQPEDDGIVTTEDVLEYASNCLAAKGIRPSDSDAMWNAYWSFVTALEKGKSNIKKDRKRKAGKGGSPSSANAKKAKRTPSVKVQKEKAQAKSKAATKKAQQQFQSASQIENSDDEDDPITRPVQPSRSTALNVGDEIEEDEEEGEEEEEEEEEVPLVRPNRGSRKATAAQRRESNAGGYEEEGEEKLQTRGSKNDMYMDKGNETDDTNEKRVQVKLATRNYRGSTVSESPRSKSSTPAKPTSFLGKRSSDMRARQSRSSGSEISKQQSDVGEISEEDMEQHDEPNDDDDSENGVGSNRSSSPESQMPRAVKRVRL